MASRKKRATSGYVACPKCGYPVAWQHYHKVGKKRLSRYQTSNYLSWLTREAKKGDPRAVALVPGGENLQRNDPES